MTERISQITKQRKKELKDIVTGRRKRLEEERVKALSVISQRYAVLEQGITIGLDITELGAELTSLGEAVASRRDGEELLREAAEQHMNKKTIPHPHGKIDNNGNTVFVSRSELLGPEKVSRKIDYGVELVRNQVVSLRGQEYAR